MRTITIYEEELRQEIDIAQWELELGESDSALRNLLTRLRDLADRRHGRFFRMRMLLRLDRGGIAWD